MASKRWRPGFTALWALLVGWPIVAWPVSFAAGDDSSSSGPKLIGSGGAATAQREVEKFADISVSSAIKLDVNVGPEVEIAVTADDNILPHVITEVAGDRLKIYVDQNYKSKLGVKVNMSTPELRGLRGSGAVKTTVTNASGERFRLGLSGASECKWKGEVEALAMKLDGGSKANVSGSATRLDANCSGAAKLDARDLTAKSGKLVLSGASTARVNVSDVLNVTASGASSLKYAGQPTIEKTVSGASRVSAE
ncbi:MAG TPA: head GIN domain-containing protein [Lacipirellulaceae bacterium]|nr:head GIN domain-containing protein [Lacipirellulaceae bacterium]